MTTQFLPRLKIGFSNQLVISKLLLKILSIKIIGTCFALFVYAKFTPLSDTENYLQPHILIASSGKFTTIIMKLLGRTFFQLFGNFGSNILISLSVGVSLYYVIRHLTGIRKNRAFLAICLPSFMVWCSIFSKESFAVIGGFFVLQAWFERLHKVPSSLKTTLLFWVGIGFLILIRPPYGAAAAWLYFITWAVDNRPSSQMGALQKHPSQNSKKSPRPLFKGPLGYFSLGTLCVFGCVCFIALFPIIRDLFSAVIGIGLQYFQVANSKADRAWLSWGTEQAYWKHLWWSFWFGIIGPLPSEVFNRIEFLPFFLEGCLILYLTVSALINGIRNTKILDSLSRRMFQKVFFLGLLPSLIFLALIQASLGTINPGSATRYRTGFEFFLTIAPLLFWQAVVMTPHKIPTPMQHPINVNFI